MKITKIISLMVAISLISLTSWQCKFGNAVGEALMPGIEEDRKLGEKVDGEIRSKSNEYPLLPERGNEELYGYVRGITQKILNSGNVQYAKEFAWRVMIINDPKTLNAFCTPGGYIYVYTGLIKYLDSEDQLAGVMAHEIAHADRRHSMKQMMKMYGVQMLVAIGAQAVASKQGETGQQATVTIAQLAGSLIGLSFSRDHETDADNQSVNYLCGTEYNSAGAAGFFEKMGNAGSPPQFLSTHPNPTNRVANIKSQAQQKTCKGNDKFVARYQRIKALIR
jgi:predicted Zn-dependent protease